MSDQQNTDQELLSFIREARKFLTLIESPSWVGSAELTDDQHLAEIKTHLEKSRERFDLPERTVMHSVRNNEGLVLALTGNTPNAAERARFLTGLMQAMPRLLDAIDDNILRVILMEQDLENHKNRIKELIESNNNKLFENRAQRDRIRQLQAQVDLLLKSIPVTTEAA